MNFLEGTPDCPALHRHRRAISCLAIEIPDSQRGAPAFLRNQQTACRRRRNQAVATPATARRLQPRTAETDLAESASCRHLTPRVFRISPARSPDQLLVNYGYGPPGTDRSLVFSIRRQAICELRPMGTLDKTIRHTKRGRPPVARRGIYAANLQSHWRLISF